MWCETNLRRCISKFHRFICECCDKAFPLRSALERHRTLQHRDKDTCTEERAEPTAEEGAEDGREQAGFLEVLGLQHVSKVSRLSADAVASAGLQTCG